VNSELNYDHLYYLVSVDNAHFYGRQISGHDEDWFGASLDLASVPTLGSILGEPQVWVAIVFQSDASINLPEGAYVDEVVVRKCLREPCDGGGSATGGPSGDVVIEPAALTLER
jgi:hypothetical protein